MGVEERKREAARAALGYVPPGRVLGVGTGSTAECFIEELAASDLEVTACVASSERSAKLLREVGLAVVGIPEEPLEVYVDGADEFDPDLRLLKGGGGAHTREKAVATASRRFVCIVDDTKRVPALGASSPVVLAVVPFAVPLVTRLLAGYGEDIGIGVRGECTDDGDAIVDVSGLDLSDPKGLERELGSLPGVVENGIFAARPADVVLMADGEGVRTFRRGRLARSGPAG